VRQLKLTLQTDAAPFAKVFPPSLPQPIAPWLVPALPRQLGGVLPSTLLRSIITTEVSE